MKKNNNKSILISEGAGRRMRLVSYFTEGSLFLITAVSAVAVTFIIFFIARDALPFFNLRGIGEFFTGLRWYPSGDPAEFGAWSIIFGSIMVTVLSALVAVPLGLLSALSLSDIIPFSMRQVVKPIIEIIAAIPSVAYGFFALVIFAPILQKSGGHLLGAGVLLVGVPLGFVCAYIMGELISSRFLKNSPASIRLIPSIGLGALLLFGLLKLYNICRGITISSGTNALNVSVVLGIMALPTIVSVAEDALQSVGRELREGSYALGSTRAETLFKVVIPAAKPGIAAAVILGIMRAVGETMVVWMASGNAAQVPEPWFNILEPIRTLTATIAGDMGEADHVTGSARYHVLFAMALLLLVFSFAGNFFSEWLSNRAKKKLGG
ncbi:MAG: phosphate ABC transporter permease subunit PstC [bacterium]|nr:phosphate ABC transporter permease subunit PstC [bacterium]